MAAASPDLAPLRELLSSLTIADLCPKHQRVVALSHSYTVGDALKIMSRRRILSAPVVIEPALEDAQAGVVSSSATLLGWLDLASILDAFLTDLRAAAAPEPLPTRMLSLMSLIEKHAPAFAARKLVTLRDSEDRELVFGVESSNLTLLQAVRDLFLPGWTRADAGREGEGEEQRGEAMEEVAEAVVAEGPGGVPVAVVAEAVAVTRGAASGAGSSPSPFSAAAPPSVVPSPLLISATSPVPPPAPRRRAIHRLAVLRDGGEIAGVVSQMDAVRAVLARADALGPLADASLESLGLARRPPGSPVVAVPSAVPTLVALADLAHRGLSGGPVLAPSGDLLANVSVSDLRSITAEHLGVLALPVAEFLAVQHGTAYLGYSAAASGHAGHAFFGSASRGYPAAGSPRAAGGGAQGPLGAGAASPSPAPSSPLAPVPLASPVLGPGSGRLEGFAREADSSAMAADPIAPPPAAAAGPASPASASPPLAALPPLPASPRVAPRPSPPPCASAGAAGATLQGDVQIFVVAPETTFRQLLEKLVGKHVHRVYVLKPGTLEILNVVSLTDVLALAL